MPSSHPCPWEMMYVSTLFGFTPAAQTDSTSAALAIGSAARLAGSSTAVTSEQSFEGFTVRACEKVCVNVVVQFVNPDPGKAVAAGSHTSVGSARASDSKTTPVSPVATDLREGN